MSPFRVFTATATPLLLNLHGDAETKEVLATVVLQHPLALDLYGGVDRQHRDRHVVHLHRRSQYFVKYSNIWLKSYYHFILLGRAVAVTEVLASVHWASIEGELDAGRDDANNLVVEKLQVRWMLKPGAKPGGVSEFLPEFLPTTCISGIPCK